MENNIVMETKHCDNCKKDVPIGNYLNHSIHCPRNIRLCPKCDEPYPIIEMDRHIAEDHEEVVCPECYVFMEAVDLPEHQSASCPKRLVSCMICEVDVPASELSDHLDYCGARSDRCSGCGKMVLMKFQAFHLFTQHALTKPENERQLAQSTLSFLSQYRNISGNQEEGNPSVSTTTTTSSSKSSVARPTANASLSSNKSLVDVTGSTGEQSSASNRLGAGVSSLGLAAPSSTVLAMLQPVLTSTHAPSNSRPETSVAPSNSLPGALAAPSNSLLGASVVPSNSHTGASIAPSNSLPGALAAPSNSLPGASVVPSNSHTGASIAPSNSLPGAEVASTRSGDKSTRNVDAAITECVNSICAGLKLSSKSNATNSAFENSKITNNALNNSHSKITNKLQGSKINNDSRVAHFSSNGSSAVSSPSNFLASGSSSNSVNSGFSSNPANSGFEANRVYSPTLVNGASPYNAPSSSVLSSSFATGLHNAPSTVVNDGGMTSGLNSMITGSGSFPYSSSQSKIFTSAANNNTLSSAGSTRSNDSNSIRNVLTSRNNEVNSMSLSSEQDGANSLNSMFTQSLSRPPPRAEVLVPQCTGPRVTPVNQAPPRTRKRDFPDDALNEYMLRLSEQGLADGLSSVSSSSQTDSKRKQSAKSSAATTSRNALRERVALIRRDREERLAQARATNTPLLTPIRPHIAQALSIANPPETLASELTGASMPPRNHRDSSNDTGASWSDYLEAVPNPRTDSLLDKLTRAMPLDSTDAPGRPVTRQSRSDAFDPSPTNRSTRARTTRPSNFDALTHPRPRRDEVLTRAELRGLNEALETDRQVQNREAEDEAGLCLPCEFCEAPIPVDHLILHQTGCRPDLIYH